MISADARWHSFVNIAAAAFSGAAAGILFHFNGVLYLLFIVIALYFIRRKHFMLTPVFTFFLLIMITFQGIRVLGLYYLIPFTCALVGFTGLFLLFRLGRYPALIIFILGIPLIQFLLGYTGYFPGFDLSFPIIDLIPPNIPFNPLIASFVFSLLGGLTIFRRGYVPLLIFTAVMLLIPHSWFQREAMFMRVSAPGISQGSVLQVLNGSFRGEGVILGEYFFPRDMRPVEETLKESLQPFFAKNRFLAYGYTFSNHSYASLMFNKTSLHTTKRHPVLGMETRSSEKLARSFYYGTERFHLFICQDILFPDAYLSVKRGDTVINPRRIPLSWGITFRKAMERARNYYKNMGAQIYASSF